MFFLFFISLQPEFYDIYTLLAARNEENWHDAIPVFRHKCTWLCAEQQW